jgi:hypothetical protein
VTNADEPWGQDVEKKTSQELLRRQAHHFGALAFHLLHAGCGQRIGYCLVLKLTCTGGPCVGTSESAP